METLIQRLVANPHDEEALAYAHRAGGADPRAYAILLEKVGQATTDTAYAAHWLSEAANVWSTTIGDAHHAARTLMIAIEKDPTQRTAADRLSQLYRDKGDLKALIALLERLVKSLAPLTEQPEVREHLLSLHEELGRLWGDPPFSRPERAVENWRRLAELDPRNAYAIYAARELYKSQQQYAEAVPFFAMEQAIVDDPERKLALYRDEADIQRRANNLAGVTQALRGALALNPSDVGLKQEVGALILERIDAGEQVGEAERAEAAGLFVSLAETYDGEYGYSYSTSALKAVAGNDRAMQLADYYGGILGRTTELGPRYAAYLQASPNGFMAEAARAKVGNAAPPPPPVPAPPPAAAPAAQPSVPGAAAVESASRISISGAPAPSSGNAVESPSRTSSPGVAPAASASEPPPARQGSIPPVNPADLAALIEEAQSESQKGRKPQALVKFREALKIDPANPEALSWVEEHLRQKRMYADLRDVLLAAARVPTAALETRKAQLRDVAGLAESQLRDLETSISAWKSLVQLDRGDEQAREQLRRLLEKGSRWDDLATMLEQEAMSTTDSEEKIALEKKLAALHEGKRKDPAAAAEAWARIATLTPQDDAAVLTAVKLYEKGERYDLAAQVISDNVAAIDDKDQKTPLLVKLGDLRAKSGDSAGAGDAYAEAAELGSDPKVWEMAEKAYVTAERFADAATAVEKRADLAEGKAKAALLAHASEILVRIDDVSGAILKLEQATEIDPGNDAFADALADQYRRETREPDLIKFLLGRAEKMTDKDKRVAGRKAAAELQRQLGDKEGARESLVLVVSDGDEAGALGMLVDDAVERGDHQEAVDFLRRLGALATTPQEKVGIALREAAMLADAMEDLEGAIARYEAVLADLDPTSRPALQAIAAISEKRDDPKGVAGALEREIPLAAEGEERVEIAQRLAQLYEGRLGDPRGAIKALELVHAADPEDFDAIARLQKLSEEIEDWPRVATLMAALIEVEGDEEEASRMTVRLSEILTEKLNRGDEALAALEKMADLGDQPSRDAYVALGDKLGWKGIVAGKLVTWNESTTGPARHEALRSAFDRFLEIGRDADAARVAMDLARTRGADRALGEKLEEIAGKLHDLDALGVAHDLLGKDLTGVARATELVRQAEMRAAAGVDPLEAMQHGESALTSVPPGEVEPLLTRLAALTQAPGHVIDLYERQVGRCRLPQDRLVALARAAQIAAERGANDRARSFFELALGGGVQEDTIGALEAAARLGDERAGGTALRAILAEALAAGGQGSRDGGRTRGALLRRAATIASRDLGDIDRAFGWLGDALITHVDDASLDALEELGKQIGSIPRVEATLTRALEEVFDGPLVRKLIQKRARLRQGALGDKKGAAVDLKKLHDLSPADQEVMSELSALLLELGDHRGMIQLYEDQILRGRDPAQRAELARKVARIWEEDLADAREAADAWRRVLRMKAGDAEATGGLDRAKSGKLKKASPRAHAEAPTPSAAPPPMPPPSKAPSAAPPPKAASVPPPAPPPPPAPAPPPVAAPPPSFEPAFTAPEIVEPQAPAHAPAHVETFPEPAPYNPQRPQAEAPAHVEAAAPEHVAPPAHVEAPAYAAPPAHVEPPAYAPAPPAYLAPEGAPAYLAPQGAPAYLAPEGAPSYLSPEGAPSYLSPQGAPSYLSPEGAPSYLSPEGAPAYLAGAPAYAAPDAHAYSHGYAPAAPEGHAYPQAEGQGYAPAVPDAHAYPAEPPAYPGYAPAYPGHAAPAYPGHEGAPAYQAPYDPAAYPQAQGHDPHQGYAAPHEQQAAWPAHPQAGHQDHHAAQPDHGGQGEEVAEVDDAELLEEEPGPAHQ